MFVVIITSTTVIRNSAIVKIEIEPLSSLNLLAKEIGFFSL
jgi:hypothetical protein